MLGDLGGQTYSLGNATRFPKEPLNRGGAHIRRRLSRAKSSSPHVRRANWLAHELWGPGKDKNLVSTAAPRKGRRDWVN